jgi:hypothetical protein
MTWTPGPWTVEEPFDGPDEFHGVPVFLSNGLLVFMEEHYGRDAKNWEADLRLASLAPEMAELLERMVDHPWGYDDIGGKNVHSHQAAALLARARGEHAPSIPEDSIQEEGTVQGPS